jgi:hypothetical protein
LTGIAADEKQIHWEGRMKVQLQVIRNDKTLCVGTYDIDDSDSFTRAFADVWQQLRRKQLDQEPSIGAVMENLADDVVSQLDGMAITIQKI